MALMELIVGLLVQDPWAMGVASVSSFPSAVTGAGADLQAWIHRLPP